MSRGGRGKSTFVRDLQRVLHGASLVAETMARDQAPVIRHRLGRLATHSTDLILKAPEGLSSVSTNLRTGSFLRRHGQAGEGMSHEDRADPLQAVQDQLPFDSQLDLLPNLQEIPSKVDDTFYAANTSQSVTTNGQSSGEVSSSTIQEEKIDQTMQQDGYFYARNFDHNEANYDEYQQPARKSLNERSVPSSSIGRFLGFGRMAASLAVGGATEWVRRSVSSQGNEAKSTNFFLTEDNAQRLASGLCRMRGAALKLGQMLSLQDENVLPKPIADALETVRQQADIMPKKQLHRMLETELGSDWRTKFHEFDETPIAAASIGQVHKGTLTDGRVVAMKVQYPGVAESIDSDLNNLERLLRVADFFPKGLYLESMLDVARDELKLECDYLNEAKCQRRFYQYLSDDPDFVVPEVVDELTSRKVLTSAWVSGYPIDKTIKLPQEVRNGIARRLLRLTLRELFEFRFMQTDPNWGNFFYDPRTGKIALLDFGASRSYRKEFIDEYLKLVWSASNNDRDGLLEQSFKLGFLTGHESSVMTEAHVEAGMVVGEPFRTAGTFNFKQAGITARVSNHGNVFAHHRLTPPPPETYSLHRKLSGAFLICIHIGAEIPCRDLLEKLYHQYKWGGTDEETIVKLVEDTRAPSLEKPELVNALHHAQGLERKAEMIENN